RRSDSGGQPAIGAYAGPTASARFGSGPFGTATAVVRSTRVDCSQAVPGLRSISLAGVRSARGAHDPTACGVPCPQPVLGARTMGWLRRLGVPSLDRYRSLSSVVAGRE